MIILNESSKNTENALIEWLRKKTRRYFPKTKVNVFFFGFESSFWNIFSTSVLSQICKIINSWILPNPFSRNTLIPSSEKTSWSLKTSFWKKNRSINSKMVNFRGFFMTIFELIGKFYYQNDVFKLQEVFSELEIRVFLENGFGSF
jgi:hypothetical protein